MFLDYMFYRISNYYRQKEPNDAGWYYIYKPLLLLTFILQTFIFFLISFTDDYQLINGFSFDNIFPNKYYGFLLTIPILIILILIYRNRYPILDEKYRDESQETRFVKGVLVVLVLFIPLVISIGYIAIYREWAGFLDK